MSRRGHPPQPSLPGAIGAAVLATALILAVGCNSLSSPSPATRYSLASISGVPVPATFDAFRDSDGNLRTLEAVNGTLAQYPDGSYREDLTVNRKLNGEVVETLQAIIEGRVERVGQTLIHRYQSPGGYEERVDYDVLEDGRFLTGIHSNGRVWRWIREGTTQ